jgi:hypothetical protein
VPSPFVSRRLAAPDRARLLDGILARCRATNGRPPVVVFDLDGTLMDNRPRVVAILLELAAEWRERHPEPARALERVHVDTMHYSLLENLRSLGIDDEAISAAALTYWTERFFTDSYLAHDVEVAGAVSFVRACHGAGATCVYLTGRDLPNMALGTFASLRDLGFPIGVIGTELVTKPTFDMPDSTFKRSVASELARLGEVVAAFDNEPGNCNIFLEAYPRCSSVMVDTLHAPDPPALHDGVQVIEAFA